MHILAHTGTHRKRQKPIEKPYRQTLLCHIFTFFSNSHVNKEPSCLAPPSSSVVPWPRPMATVLEPGSGPEVCVSVLSEALVPEWSVCEWLQAIGMDRYRDTLAAAGYSSFPSLLALTHQ